MSYLYNFGLSQEDERTEAAALGLPGGRVVSIASAGDMPLSLLALGADHVSAVDADANQLQLLQLKLAAVRSLEREEALAFLGYLPAPARARREWLRAAAALLPEEARAFWRSHEAFVLRGVIWAGRYERYLRRLQRVLRPVFRRGIEALLACDPADEQATVFTRRFDGPFLRAAFRIGFHPAVFSSRGMDPRSLRYRDDAASLGDQYYQRFRAMCVATPARGNYLLQLHALGRLASADVAPAYLSRAGAARVRAEAHRLRVLNADVTTLLGEAKPGSFDAVHLSNLPDWLSQAQFEALLRALARAVAPDGRVLWRYLHVDRPVPPDLRATIRLDPALATTLSASDRFPFYHLVAAVVQPAAG